MPAFRIDMNTVKLLRFPFSILLMPLFLLALSQVPSIDPFRTIISFVIIHLLLYPSSNGYNSYIDRDVSSIGLLKNPPLPTKGLFYTTILMDIAAVLIAAALINFIFAVSLLVYILVSRAYSSKQIRVKKRPYSAFLCVVFFQGAFTYFMCYSGLSNTVIDFNASNIFILSATSFQIAAAYPLTQIYQHKEDISNGDISLSYKLGFKGTFILSGIMFGLACFFYLFYFMMIGKPKHFFIYLIFGLPVVLYFFRWYFMVMKNNSKADFDHTMRMNFISAFSMIVCFLILILLNNFN
jgi:4-hydroxybenzoate polyprenyltransferase